MVDFAKGAPYCLEAVHWDDSSLGVVEDRLAETPCHAGQARRMEVVFPDKKAPELLAAKWAG